MKTTTTENCDTCQTVKRYENTWQCIICGRKFEPQSKLEDNLKQDYKVQGEI